MSKEEQKLADKGHITAAAILYKDTVYSLPRPARHHDIIRLILETTKESSIEENEQGFLDDQGQFLRRAPALVIAERAGQLLEERPIWGTNLYSENLW